VTEYVEFTGRTDAAESVEVRARVTGFLKKVFFAPGIMKQRRVREPEPERKPPREPK